MTNYNYYHHQKQEDATRATTSFVDTKTPNSNSTNAEEADSDIILSPVRGTIANSASSSPLSFGIDNITSTNPGSSSNNKDIMATTNHDPSRGFSSQYVNQNGQPELRHRSYISASQNQNSFQNVAFSRGPLSPQSAPPTTSVVAGDTNVSTATTPVPSVIHTESSTDGETIIGRAGSEGSAPYFPSINRSSSGNMSGGATSGSSNIVPKRSATKVTGKKKHQNNKTKSGTVHSVSSPRIHDGGGGNAATTNGQKKQRRLERNRLSAQLSRRRRKQYLEELEVRVVRLSLEMDRGRRTHAFQAIKRISEMRNQVLESAEAVVREIESSPASIDNNSRTAMLIYQLENYLRLLENAGPLSRTGSEELLILNSFLGQQLKSFSLPSHSKFILWLSLQGDIYYRGGRAASERLSAARIGERVSCIFHCLFA